MTLTFQPAEKRRSKLRLALDGPSGSGKTWTALTTATALAAGGRVAVIDTEHGSASLYADHFTFDVLELNGNYDPARYAQAIKLAESSGYQVIVVDSLSHAWEGEGGVLEIVDRGAARRGGNSFAGWADGTPAHRSLVDAILKSPAHVICTMRTKTEWAENIKNGRKTYERVGTAPVMRQGIEYEFTVVGDLDLEHVMTVTKSRCPQVADKRYRHPGREFGLELLAWLNDGGDPVEPVWKARWDAAVAAFGEERCREVMKSAAPSVLEDDAVNDRFTAKLGEAWAREDAEVVTPRGVANPAPVGVPGVPETAQDTPGTPTITDGQLRRLHAIAGEHGVSDAESSAITYQVCGATSRKDIPVDRYEDVITAIQAAGGAA